MKGDMSKTAVDGHFKTLKKAIFISQWLPGYALNASPTPKKRFTPRLETPPGSFCLPFINPLFARVNGQKP